MLALTPSLANLATVLRHPEMWPEDFVWDYGDCSRCAMGLAHQLWREVYSCDTISMHQLEPRLSYCDLSRIFLRANVVLGYEAGENIDKVTPEHIADMIEAHLEMLKGDYTC